MASKTKKDLFLDIKAMEDTIKSQKDVILANIEKAHDLKKEIDILNKALDECTKTNAQSTVVLQQSVLAIKELKGIVKGIAKYLT